jgi:hypothetical protein
MAAKNHHSDTEAAPAESLSEAPSCGLIMPISATENHDEKHWAAVQTLLHRGIRAAGLTPANVWEGVNDRISKRIVGNIFRQDIVVADISDLNPNVMLELGLRLASKKPTVVIFNKGGKIPFDINDVEAIPYPGDLNILEMEAFFEKFSNLLKARLAAFKAGTYEPYLGDVVVEVLEPQTKEISVENLVLERLDELNGRMSRIERNSGRSWREGPTSASAPGKSRAHIYAWIPIENAEEFEASLGRIVSKRAEIDRGDKRFYKLYSDGDLPTQHFVRRIETRTSAAGGGLGVPEDVQVTLEMVD